MNKRKILHRQDKLCICFIYDLKRLSNSEFLISKGLIPYFILNFCLDASILGFLKS